MTQGNSIELCVRDLMTKQLVALPVESSVVDAALVMTNRGIASVLVTAGGAYVGIVTDRDVIGKVVARNLPPHRVRLADVMTSPLVSIRDDASVQAAAEAMRNNKIRRLVVTHEGQIVGIISESDIIRVEPELHFLIRERSRLGLGGVAPLEPSRPLINGFCEDCGNYSEDLRNMEGHWLCEDCRGH